MDLSKNCTPYENGAPLLNKNELDDFMNSIDSWSLESNKIKKHYEFKDFKESMLFVNKIADLAENQGHHPDISISWNKVIITLWTHSVNNLSENDFIMAHKIDELNK